MPNSNRQAGSRRVWPLYLVKSVFKKCNHKMPVVTYNHNCPSVREKESHSLPGQPDAIKPVRKAFNRLIIYRRSLGNLKLNLCLRGVLTENQKWKCCASFLRRPLVVATMCDLSAEQRAFTTVSFILGQSAYRWERMRDVICKHATSYGKLLQPPQNQQPPWCRRLRKAEKDSSYKFSINIVYGFSGKRKDESDAWHCRIYGLWFVCARQVSRL